jgi:phage terminase large subunit-like protein
MANLWDPIYKVDTLTTRSRGQNVIDFAEIFMKASRGYKMGEPLIFSDWQKYIIKCLLEEKENGLLRYRRALIGLPRKNGKSLLGTALALESLVYGKDGGQIYSAAADRAQARIVFGEARQQVLNNQYLSEHVKVYRDALENPRTGTVYRALSSDGARAHGLAPSLVIADELHIWPSSPSNHKGDELWEALVSGSSDRAESLVVGITTAGSNSDTLLGQLYTHGKRIATGEDTDNAFGFWWWEAPEGADPTDKANWFLANPNLAEGLLSIEDFEANIKQAEVTGFSSFQRFHLNQWVRLQGEDFVNPTFWTEAHIDIPVNLGDEVVLGFDGAVSGDCTGLIAQNIHTGVYKVLALWEPDISEPDWHIDKSDVDAAVHKAFKDYDVKMMWCDSSYYKSDVDEWAKTYRNRVQDIPQSNSRIIPLAQQFLSDLVSKTIGHDGKSPALTRHVLNAVATEGGSYRKEKKKSPLKIDLLVCAVMANGARHAYNLKPKIKRRNIIL